MGLFHSGIFNDSPDFTAAVRKQEWKKAYDILFKLEDNELFGALHPLTDKERSDFWAAELDDKASDDYWAEQKVLLVYWRLHRNYKHKLDKFEYALATVQYHTIPSKLPNHGPEMEKYAKRYLRWRSRGHKHSTLEQNLGYSMQAVNYVLTTLGVTAANWDYYRARDKDKEQTFEYWDKKWRDLPNTKKNLKTIKKYQEKALANRTTDDIKLYFEARVELDEFDDGTLNYLRLVAEKAKQTRIGNCGENAILAYIYLYDMGVRPIDYMSASIDHDFVVIGRNACDPDAYDDWGNVAVVCDPWGQGYFYGRPGVGTFGGSPKAIRDGLAQVCGYDFTLTNRHRAE